MSPEAVVPGFSEISPRAGLREELTALRDSVAELQRRAPNPRHANLQEEARALMDPPLGWRLPDLAQVNQEQVDQLALDNARLRLVLAKCFSA